MLLVISFEIGTLSSRDRELESGRGSSVRRDRVGEHHFILYTEPISNTVAFTRCRPFWATTCAICHSATPPADTTQVRLIQYVLYPIVPEDIPLYIRLQHPGISRPSYTALPLLCLKNCQHSAVTHIVPVWNGHLTDNWKCYWTYYQSVIEPYTKLLLNLS